MILYCIKIILLIFFLKIYVQGDQRLPLGTIGRSCRATEKHFTGVCRRYEDCRAAVVGWTEQRIAPVYCFYTKYEQIVCCPQATNNPVFPQPTSPFNPYQPSVPLAPLTNTFASSSSAISNGGTASASASAASFYLNISPSIFPQPGNLRRSEQECHALYLNHQAAHHHHHYPPYYRRHHKREVQLSPLKETNFSEENNNNTDNESPTLENMEAIEEIVQKRKSSQTEVVGGFATFRDEFPYMCALGWRLTKSDNNKYGFHCGCVLIAKRFALTAAHCLALNGESPVVVRLGGDDLTSQRAEIIKIKQLIPHSGYNDDLTYNDIALIKLERNSRKTPACLWADNTVPNERVIALGYGQTKFAGPSSNSLLKVFLNTVDNQQCDQQYIKEDFLKNGINPGQICAIDYQGRMDTCQGDSGGPLILNVAKNNVVIPYVVGLTSFGKACAAGTPSVYTRISYFLDWIEPIVFT